MRIPQPMSKEEADAGGRGSVWRVGTYDFEVHDAADDVSKSSGEEMIKLTLYVFDTAGDKRTVFDYLPSAEKAQWKVRGFCQAVGLVAQYESGELDVNDIYQRTGKLKLGIRKAQGEYPESNMVTAYIDAPDQPPRAARPSAPAQRTPAARQPARAAADLDDEIPF